MARLRSKRVARNGAKATVNAPRLAEKPVSVTKTVRPDGTLVINRGEDYYLGAAGGRRNWTDANGVTMHNVGLHGDGNGGRIGEGADNGKAAIVTITAMVLQRNSEHRRTFSRLVEQCGVSVRTTGANPYDRHQHVIRVSGPEVLVQRFIDHCNLFLSKLVKQIEVLERRVPRYSQGSGAEKVVKRDIRDQQEKVSTVQGRTLKLSHVAQFDRSAATVENGSPITLGTDKPEYVPPPKKDNPKWGRGPKFFISARHSSEPIGNAAALDADIAKLDAEVTAFKAAHEKAYGSIALPVSSSTEGVFVRQ